MKLVLIIVTLASLVCGSELEESEQKKRGATKTTTLNAIPSGAQKPEYTYSIYPQNPSQSQYQSQIPNSFYPSQTNQYYTSSTPTETPYQQPPINLIPPPNSQQFVPLNFLNQGYQKYQVLPKGQNGNFQLIVQQPVQSLGPYQNLFGQQQNPQNLLNLQPQNYNLGQNLQPFSFNNPYLGQSTMLLLAQPNPSLYNNLLYPNPGQNLYNYYQNPPQRYTPSYTQPQEYDKPQGPVSQSASKDDNDIAHSSNPEYLSQDSASYKSPYSSRSYTKL